MKKLILAAALLCPVVLSAQKKAKEKPYTIQGTIVQQEAPTKVTLRYRKDGKIVTDTTLTADGRFVFQGTVPEPMQVQLLADVPKSATNMNGKTEVAPIFLAPGTTTVTMESLDKKGTATGTAAQDDYNQLNALLDPLYKQGAELNKEYRALREAKDEAGMKKLETRFEQLEASRKAVLNKYLEDRPGSPLGIFVLSQVAGYDLDPEKIDPLFNRLSKSVRNTPSGKQFEERLDIARKVRVGNPAIEFSQNDPSGKPVSLASFRGKYVLVDFWASWCGPCRAENPNVVKAFNTYKDKGFTVLGVSFDDNKEKWVEAIDKDELHWTQVSDLKGWSNEVGKMYGIRAIPQNLLLDPEGKILAKNLRGEALESKLAELFK